VSVLDSGGATTRLASVAPDGTPGNAPSYQPVISGNGRRVVFLSAATNLVPGNDFGFPDLFVHDLETGETARVTTAGWNAGASPGSLPRVPPAISDDGRYIAFTACNAHIVPEDVEEMTPCRVYFRDVDGGTTRLVSADANGTPTAGASGTYGINYEPPIAISGDGRRVGFMSNGTDLVPGYVGDPGASFWEFYVKQMLPPP
jgi:Tol biopolymer transport system component